MDYAYYDEKSDYEDDKDDKGEYEDIYELWIIELSNFLYIFASIILICLIFSSDFSFNIPNFSVLYSIISSK